MAEKNGQVTGIRALEAEAGSLSIWNATTYRLHLLAKLNHLSSPVPWQAITLPVTRPD